MSAQKVLCFKKYICEDKGNYHDEAIKKFSVTNITLSQLAEASKDDIFKG